MTDYDFTETFRRALGAAREEAASRRDEYVDNAHVLVALTRSSDRTLRALWDSVGVDAAELGSALAVSNSSDRVTMSGPDLRFSRISMNAMEFAMSEARIQGDAVEPSHLLMGIAAVDHGAAKLALDARDLTVESMRAALAHLKGQGIPEPVESVQITIRLRDGLLVEKRFETHPEEVYAFIAPYLNRFERKSK